MNKNFIILISLVFIQLFARCSSRGNIYKKDYKFVGKISADNFEIIIQDKRKKVDNRSINIPFITVPGDNDLVHPVLDVNSINNIASKIIKKFIIRGNKSLIIQINVLDAYQQFNATAASEIEFVYARIKILIIDRKNRQILNSVRGQAWGDHSSLDASLKRINYMLDKAFERSIYEALINLN